MRKYAIGVVEAAAAAGCSKTHISLVATGKRKTSNELVNLAIQKYVHIVELPEHNIEAELENMVRRLK